VNLHGPVRAAAIDGTAEVLISIDAWPEGAVIPSAHTITVLAPKPGLKTEPVTDRLFKTLPHPDRSAAIGEVVFSPDGSRMLMAGYPTGVIQIWDAKTWKETSRIESPSGLRSSYIYARPTPDWRSILVPVMRRKAVRDQKEGKVTQRLQIDGRIDRYDPTTGKLQDSVLLADRGPHQVFISPDGKFAIADSEHSFAVGEKRAQYVELIDLSTKSTKKLLDFYCQPEFTRDGKTVFVSLMRVNADGSSESSLVKLDLLTGKVLNSKEYRDKHALANNPVLSPDGKRLFVQTGRWVNRKSEDGALSILDPNTFEEVSRIEYDAKNEPWFGLPQFSVDEKTMLVRLGSRLILWDLTAGKTLRTIPISDIYIGHSFLSRDGKFAVTVGMPKFDSRETGTDPLDLPQPRAYLIDLTDSQSAPQRIMLPSGMVSSAALSIDGRTLAVGATGGVLLIDLTAKRTAKP
jgi:WD40 repeat protein